MKVLVVDDSVSVRKALERILSTRQIRVVATGSGEEALQKLPGSNPALIIADVVMPGMDGPTWVRTALRDRPGTKVIFVSGYSEVTLSDASAPIPGALFLPKPFSLSELTATVENHLAGRPGPAVSAETTPTH